MKCPRTMASRPTVSAALSGSRHQALLCRLQIPLEKGYSQMEWMRLAKTHPDLAGETQVRLHVLSRRDWASHC